jgi:hypothetical protein
MVVHIFFAHPPASQPVEHAFRRFTPGVSCEGIDSEEVVAVAARLEGLLALEDLSEYILKLIMIIISQQIKI